MKLCKILELNVLYGFKIIGSNSYPALRRVKEARGAGGKNP